MTKFHDDNSAKKSGLGKFLSGVSGVALLLGATYGSQSAKAGITVSAPSVPAISISAASTTSFILVTTGGVVHGNITNNGTVGPSGTAIEVSGGGIVGGAIINFGLITATSTGIRLTGAAVTTTVSNAGTIKVSATSTNTTSASGTAAGIHISSTGSLLATITNSGLIDVDAIAVASGSSASANANAVGIEQFATSASASVALAVMNIATGTGTMAVTGSLDVFASARASGTSSTAQADASAGGVHQTISSAPAGFTASTLFTNQGNVDVFAVASATSSSSSANADANAWGVKQQISGNSNSANATFVNETSASFDVFAIATAGGVNGDARATATGVRQTVSADNLATATIINQGSFSVLALATATGNNPSATAVVSNWFFQSASATGGAGSTALVTFDNSGSISLTALALGTDPGGADARVRLSSGAGFGMHADAEDATTNFVNSGTISMLLGAQALATSGSASASVDFSSFSMFDLDARTTSSSASSFATVSFDNSGTISFSALATATGTSGADAAVSFSSGGRVVDLHADAATASVDFVNSGTLSVVLGAQAFGNSSSTSASIGGSSFTAFDLDARASFSTFGASGNAAASFSNSGIISFSALATATGASSVDASVDLFRSGAFVDVRAVAATASTSFVNSGTISVLLGAQASATNGSASASINLSSFEMFDLNASTSTSSSGNSNTVATVSFNNSGSISFSALATATGTSGADARVTFSSGGNVVDIYAFAETASASFVNSGTLSVVMSALAVATNGWASADVNGSSYTAFELDARASFSTFGASGVATVTFDNSGSISLLMQASAFGTSWASASATFESEVVDLDADAFTATNTFTNSGTFNASALAFASATSGWASADASFNNTVFDQRAGSSSFGAGSTATVSFTNSGSINLLAQASAFGTTWASASATFDDEILDQDADGDVATVSFDNSGTLNASGLAFASATNGWANANASFSDTVFDQEAASSSNIATTATVSFSNSGSINILMQATAIGTSSADARASYYYEGVQQRAYGDAATVSFDNSGSFNITALAFASATNGSASADASFSETVFEQDAGNSSAIATTATVTFDNSGSINLLLQATAIGTSQASASATFSSEIIDQEAFGSTTATVSFTNSGTFNASALALAIATNGWASADASYNDSLIEQHANATGGAGSAGAVTFTNSGSMSFSAIATALGQFGFNTTFNTAASASAFVSQVAHQHAQGETASVTFTNSGAFSVLVSALASAASDAAYASAIISAGITQFATASQGAQISATATINNSGTINFGANATAIATATASAFAIISSAFFQSANGGATNTVSFTNSGTINLTVSANAVGTNAYAFASDPGVEQNVIGEGGTDTKQGPEGITTQGSHTPANFTNSGTFNMNVNAFASGLGGPAATASAFALGVLQSLSGGSSATGSASFNNSGSYNVSARATAVNATNTESAVASATGYAFVAGSANQVLNPIVVNSGSFGVNATAIGGTANAFALGMGVSGASVSGSIWNSGTMSVTASAPGGNATAIAIGIASNVFNGTITNTGTIRVLAIGSTTAIGIGFTGTTAFTFTNTVFAGTGDLGTITNDGGTLWAGVQNGTLDFGTVIDTTGAPNPILINLQGATQQGDIWGNILLSPDDNILVTNGNTIFRGMINGTATFVGSMTISAGGTLTLATTATGPSVAYLDNYTQTSSGTLAVNIFPSSGINSLGQINAITASLAGTIQVNVVAGLYANSQTYQDVVVATTPAGLTGTWDTFVINTNTPFLSVIPIYPGDDTADLSLVRNAFTSVGGMTFNQMAAASGIENSYSTSLTGPYAAMISQMFTFGSSTFISALEQLHGADYAQNMMTNLGSMALLNYSIDDRLNAGPIASNNRQGTTLIQKGDVAIWARAQIVWGDADGDIEAPGYDQTQKAFYAGLDYAVNDDILIGFVAGYYDNELRFNNGNRKDDDGVQIGLYGEYDTQKFYIRGIGGYASYNADSVRHINFGSTVGTNFGNYDSTVTSFMIETGRRFEISQDFYFTPYGGLSYAKVKTDAFTETGLAASALAASSNSAKSFMSDLGARFTAAWDTGSNSKVIIEFGGAWQHEFKDDPLRFTTSFAGASGSAFTVIGSVIDPDTFMLNAGISLATGGGFEIKASYWGRFNSNFQEHSAGLKVLRRF